MPHFFAIILLVIALNPWNPYSFYMLLRVIVSATCVYIGYLAYQRGQAGWVWASGFLALLYNPVVPASLTREVWTVINIGTIVAMGLSMKALGKPTPAHESSEDVQNDA